MPVYTYKGYDKEGRSVGGGIEADSPGNAVSQLKQKDILAACVNKPRLAGNFFKADPAKDLPHMTRELANLLGAGVPIVETLTALSGEPPRGTVALIGIMFLLRSKIGYPEGRVWAGP